MKQKVLWLIPSCLMVAALVLASCAPAAKPTVPTTPTAPTTPTTPTAPTTPTTPTAPTTPTKRVATEKPTYGGTITIAELTFTSFDSYRYNWAACRTLSFATDRAVLTDWAVDRNLWSFPSGVGAMGPEKYMRGSLVECWETPDPLTVILHVRQGVHFHDKPPVNGREFTADDIVWNIERYKKSPFADRAKIDLVEYAKKKDKYTVELRVTPPPMVGVLRAFLDPSSMMFWPKEAVGRSGEIDDWRNIIGTGPFMMEDYVADSCVTFKRNPNYWGFDEKHPEYRLPYADFAKVLIIPDDSTQFAAMRTGKMDWLFQRTYTEVTSLLKTASHLVSRAIPASSPFEFSPRWDTAPTNDVRVRQAMNMAIDRNEIIKSFYGGYADYYIPLVGEFSGLHTPYQTLPDKPMWTTVSCKEVLSYNPKRAKELLAEAGYPNGFKTNIVTSYPYDPGLAEMLQFYLGKIGIQPEINNMEFGAFQTLRLGKKHTGLMLISGSQNPDPFYFTGWHVTGVMQNYGCVSDPYFDSLFYKARSEFDDAKREKMLIEMNSYGIENAFDIVFPNYQVLIVWQPWLGGYAGEGGLIMHNSGSLMARLWVDQALKKSLGF